MGLRLRCGLRILFIIGLVLGGIVGAPPRARAAGPPGPGCFAETNQCVQGQFLAYWQANGGLAQFGLPLTEVFDEFIVSNGRGAYYHVQYFERVRMESHPEAADPASRVLLGQFGRRVLDGVPDAPTAVASPQGGDTYFPETGHNVGPRFGAYWRERGGLAQFGFPLTELFEERLDEGTVYQVQYFARARFELHPENAAPYAVLLGQFGRQLLDGPK